MIAWIDKRTALAIHDRQLAEYGGTDGIRDEALLESALARPQQMFAYGNPTPDLTDLAATLAFGLARNHPFVDGNKRTAHVCYRAFLALNDLEMDAGVDDMYIAILSLAAGKLPEKDFAAWLRHHVKVQSGHRVQEPRGAPYRTQSARRRAVKR